MKAYKVVVRYRGCRYAPFAKTGYPRAWFPCNGKPGPWLPRSERVLMCCVGWHFFRNREAVKRDCRDSGPWPKTWRLGNTAAIGQVEFWEIHFRQAHHWYDKSAARTIRFIRKLSTDEVRALLGDS